MATIDGKIQTLIANNEMTPEALAKAMSITVDTVNDWLQNEDALSLRDAAKLCEIFAVSLQDLADDNYDFPAYEVIDNHYTNSIRDGDKPHVVLDASLKNGARLHRFVNAAGDKWSAIFIGNEEIWWDYRDQEPRMIRDWNSKWTN